MKKYNNKQICYKINRSETDLLMILNMLKYCDINGIPTKNAIDKNMLEINSNKVFLWKNTLLPQIYSIINRDDFKMNLWYMSLFYKCILLINSFISKKIKFLAGFNIMELGFFHGKYIYDILNNILEKIFIFLITSLFLYINVAFFQQQKTDTSCIIKIVTSVTIFTGYYFIKKMLYNYALKIIASRKKIRLVDEYSFLLILNQFSRILAVFLLLILSLCYKQFDIIILHIENIIRYTMYSLFFSFFLIRFISSQASFLLNLNKSDFEIIKSNKILLTAFNLNKILLSICMYKNKMPIYLMNTISTFFLEIVAIFLLDLSIPYVYVYIKSIF